jgi:17 kDa outer membrane surface antigen
VVASAPSSRSRRPGYRGTSRGWHAALRHLPLLALSLVAGGCSFSYQLDSMFAKDDRTGSVRPAATSAEPPAEADLAIARAAVGEVLTKGGKDASVPWENPHTGARGTITPLAAAYRDNGVECRDFLASYVHERAEAWMQGEACRSRIGGWEVRNLKPWRR